MPENEVEIKIKDPSKTTKFRRHGMVYRLDAWVKKDEVAKPAAKQGGFQRRGSR